MPASVVLGCPVHRVQAPEPGPDELVAVGRDAECLALAHAVQWHCERRVLLNGDRRRLPLTYANLRYPESRSDSLRFPWPTGRSRS